MKTLDIVVSRLLSFLQMHYYKHRILSGSSYYPRFLQHVNDILTGMTNRIKCIFSNDDDLFTRNLIYKDLIINYHNGKLKTIFTDSGMVCHEFSIPMENQSSLSLDELVIFENYLIIIHQNWLHTWNMDSLAIR